MREESMSIVESALSKRGKKNKKEDKKPGNEVSEPLTSEEIEERAEQAKVDFPQEADSTDGAPVKEQTVIAAVKAEPKEKNGTIQSADATSAASGIAHVDEALDTLFDVELINQSMTAERAGFISSVEAFIEMHEQAARKARRRHIADSLVSIKGMLKQYVKLSNGVNYWSNPDAA